MCIQEESRNNGLSWVVTPVDEPTKMWGGLNFWRLWEEEATMQEISNVNLQLSKLWIAEQKRAVLIH